MNTKSKRKDGGMQGKPKGLNRQQLLKPRIHVEWVPLPAWGEGEGVYVRKLSGKARDLFEASQMNDNEAARLKNFRARFVALTAADADGNLLFSEEDAEALGEQDAETLIAIFNAARKLNRLMLTKEELLAAEKNYESGQPDA